LELEHFVSIFCNKIRHKEGHRRHTDHHQGDPHVDGQHEKKGSEDRHHSCKELGKSHQKAIGKLVDICDETAHNISLGMAVDITQGQILHMVKGFCPYIH